MPKINGTCGISKTTPIKQFGFRHIIRTHLKINEIIFSKYPKAWADHIYYYFDLNAGPGILDEIDCFGEYKGSPIAFLEEASHRRLNIEAHFYEIEKNNLNSLQNYILTKPNLTPKNININFHLADSRIQIRRFCNIAYRNSKIKKFGLIYNDDNGIPYFDSLSRFFKIKCFEKLDILINCPCGDLKRTRKCSRTNKKIGNKTLAQLLSTIDKKYWLIRKPHSAHQWSFLLGSNWNNFPKFKDLGFIKKETIQGQNLFNFLNYTKKESTPNAKKQN